MSISNVEGAIRQVRLQLHHYRQSDYLYNEVTTRNVVINPMLTALGWTLCQGRRQNMPVGRSKSVPPERSLASVNLCASCSGEVSQRQAGSRLGG